MRIAWICGAAAAATLVVASGAKADGDKLAWTGTGAGSHHCVTYVMHVDMEVQADKVVGTFQQKGRPKYTFSFPKDVSGNYSGSVKLSGGSPLKIKGSATADGGTIDMDGYCHFVGKLGKQL
jgi:hypothetical protein